MTETTDKQKKVEERIKEENVTLAIGIFFLLFVFVFLGGLGLQIVYPKKEIVTYLPIIWFTSTLVVSMVCIAIKYLVAIRKKELSYDRRYYILWLLQSLFFLGLVLCFVGSIIF